MSVQSSTIALDRFSSFGDLLKYLRRRAGLTQRELSIAVGYSDTQISRLEQNERLPDLAVLTARFLPALQVEDEPAVAERLLDLAAAVSRDDAPSSGPPPYKGLLYFDEADADLFFGREALVTRLVARLTTGVEAGRRFLAVIGASGSGKSSLLRAGVVPSLQWCEASSGWPVVILTPTAYPLEALAAALARERLARGPASELVASLARDARGLQRALAPLAPPAGARLVLVVDQFEELFTLCRNEADQAAFVDNLLTAAAEPGGPAVIVIALRADFYAHCARFDPLRQAVAQHQEYLGAMTAEELRRAIAEPARRGQWKLEAGLSDLLLQDTGADGKRAPEPGALPLLSHALLATWQRRRGRTLTLMGYTASGGVRGAIAETAEAVFHDQLDECQRAIARQIFLRLTEFGEEAVTAGTRRRVAFSELAYQPDDEPAVHAVLKVLADARLITTEQDSAEVAHEALIREWPTLRGWLEENRDGLRLHRRLTEAAQDWAALGRDSGGLYRGARLAQALEWAEPPRHALDLNALERQFLEESRVLSEREAAEREAQHQRDLAAAQALVAEQTRFSAHLRARNRVLTALGAVAIVLALAAGFFGIQASQSASKAERQADLVRSSQLAAQAASLVSAHYDLAALLSVEAVHLADSAETRSALLEDLQQQPSPSQSLRGHIGPVTSVAFSPDGKTLASASQDATIILWDVQSRLPLGPPLTGHTSVVTSLAFSPDGNSLASASKDSTIILWDVTTRQPIGSPLTWHGGGLSSVVFSPDGQTLAAGYGDSGIVLWDVKGRQPVGLPLQDPVRGVKSVAFSPDGKTLAAGYSVGSIILWDVNTRQPLGSPLPNNLSDVLSVAFSPDGQTLAAGSQDGAIRLWDVSSHQAIGLPLMAHANGVKSVAFSRAGKTLASGGYDGVSRLWDVATRQPLGPPLVGHTTYVLSVAFSPDGQTLASGCQDATITLWDVGLRQRLGQTLAGQGGSVDSVAFSADGKTLASGGYDGGIRLWDLAARQPLGPPLSGPAEHVYSVAFSPDRETLASGGSGGAILLWDVRTRLPLGPPLAGHNGDVLSVRFNPDGRTLASGGQDGTIRLWDVRTRQAIGPPLTGHSGSVTSLAFSPDGQTLASASQDGTLRLWDLLARQVIGPPLTGHNGGVTSVVFSPDGQSLVSGGYDGTLRLWDRATRQSTNLPVADRIQPVTSVTFSPDGRTLAAAIPPGIIQLWDVAGRQPIGQPLTGHKGGVTSLAFSPDGQTLASGSNDTTIGLWDVSLASWQSRACAMAGRNLTRAEWNQYLPGKPYRATCAQWPAGT